MGWSDRLDRPDRSDLNRDLSDITDQPGLAIALKQVRCFAIWVAGAAPELAACVLALVVLSAIGLPQLVQLGI